jgi:hypothetical protein
MSNGPQLTVTTSSFKMYRNAPLPSLDPEDAGESGWNTNDGCNERFYRRQ